MKCTWPMPAFCVGTQRNLYSTGWRRGLASGKTQILALGNAKIYQHVGTSNAKFWCRGHCPMPTPDARYFASQWNIGLRTPTWGKFKESHNVFVLGPVCEAYSQTHPKYDVLFQNIPTYLQRKILASGALPNANPRRQVFCVAVEYRLKDPDMGEVKRIT